jgi:hypothetical protein
MKINENVIIIASGPSILKEDFSIIPDKYSVITINDSYKLYDRQDIIYASDYSWWVLNEKDIHDKKCEKICCSTKIPPKEWNVKRIAVDKRADRLIYNMNKDIVCWAGNSGFQAFNLAINRGAKRILLLGYDMTIKNGHHWHGKHENGLLNPSEEKMEKWISFFNNSVDILKNNNIEVINCSMDSHLNCFNKKDFKSCINE